MSQLPQEERAERVPIGAFVDREQRDELVRLARQSDCSISRIVRRAIARSSNALKVWAVFPSLSRRVPHRAPRGLRTGGAVGLAATCGAEDAMTWRTVTDKRGTWRVRDKPGHPGTVERVRIDGGDIIRGCPEPPRLIEGGRTRSSVAANGQKLRSTPASSRPAR